MSLDTTFAGLTLTSPIIAASAPPTESVATIRACAAAGAGAVVTKSIVNYRRGDFPAIPRRAHFDRPKRAHTIFGSFDSETLTLIEGLGLVADSRATVDIPVIASVGVLESTSDAAVETAVCLAEAGAHMIHFDLFYLPHPRCSDASLDALGRLFTHAKAALSVPFGAKFNLDIPADAIACRFDPGVADAWFLLDSIRVPPPLDSNGAPRIENLSGALEASQFGAWQKPVSLQYCRVLADARFPNLCVGGGLSSAEDILEATMLGAMTAQVATPIMVHGYDWIRKTNERLLKLLEVRNASLESLRGLALRTRDAAGPEAARKVIAVIQPDACTNCGVCTKLVFCPFIADGGEKPPTISPDCYGCGFCEALCPHPGAIVMEAAA